MVGVGPDGRPLGRRAAGALERHIAGIFTKVLSERLRKLTHYGLLDKHVVAEVPPRTEYALTRAGRELAAIIAKIHDFEERIKQGEPADA